ncbi:MAG: hypothetical protein R2827_09220 [Bdellovibrionales bacterium]
MDDERAIADSYVEILCPDRDNNVVPMSSRSSRSTNSNESKESDSTAAFKYEFEVDVAYSADEP